MSFQTIQTMLFTQIIAFKGYLDNQEKPFNSTLIYTLPKMSPAVLEYYVG